MTGIKMEEGGFMGCKELGSSFMTAVPDTLRTIILP